ncbi:protein kinase domain-containing protein [Candidatus Uabimicrobium amorphum]
MKETDTKFGQLALSNNMINSQMLTYCMNLQKSAPHKSLSTLLVENGFLNSQQVTQIQNRLVERNTQKVGRYEIIEEVGRGGMGVIYKARDTITDIVVAMKILLHSNEENNKRFLREAKTIARLQHPNIVRLYDVGQERNMYYFTMDFVTGHSLDEVMKGEASLSIRKVVQLMIKVCDAIHYAHEQSVIHRDLKPANIMLEDDEPKVMDFGLAKVQDASQKLSMSGAIIGTIYYMSPEQVQGRIASIDARSDVYSLGAVLYTLLTGRPPFTGNSIPQVSQQILEKEIVPPSNIKHMVAKSLDAICQKSMAKAKNDRYQSAAEMGKDLQKFLRGEKVERGKSQQYKKVTSWLKGNTIILLVFALILGMVSFIFWSSYDALQRKYQALSNNRNFAKNIPGKSQKEQLFAVFAKAIEYRNAGEPDLALKEFDKVVAIDPSYTRAYLERSLIYYQKRNWDLASRNTNKVLELDPFESMALYNKGTGYKNNRKYDQALVYLEKAVKSKPMFYSAWLSIGRIHLGKKKYSEAAKSFNNALKVKHGPQAHFSMGVTQYRLQDYDEAIRHYSLAVAFGYKDVSVYRNRSACYSEKKQYAKTIEDINRVLEKEPQDVTMHNTKAYSYAKLGQFEVAKKHVNNALKIRVTRAALDTKGEIFNHQGMYDDALGVARQSIELEEFGDAYYNRAISYYMLEKYDLARTSYVKALSLEKLATEEEYFEDIPSNSSLSPQQQAMKEFFRRIRDKRR